MWFNARKMELNVNESSRNSLIGKLFLVNIININIKQYKYNHNNSNIIKLEYENIQEFVQKM